MNEIFLILSLSLKKFSVFLHEEHRLFTEPLSCDLSEREMCVEEFVYSATPNLVLIAFFIFLSLHGWKKVPFTSITVDLFQFSSSK